MISGKFRVLETGRQPAGWCIMAGLQHVAIAGVKWLCAVCLAVAIGLSSMPWGWAQTLPDHLTKVQIQTANDLRQQAFVATDRGDFATAEKYWTQLIALFPDNPVGWSNRGTVRAAQNHLEAAIADYDRAIALAPDAPDPYLNRGTVLERLEQWDAAIADYNRLLELTPNDPMALNNRGNARAGLGNWEGAIADYQTAIDLAPNFATARINQALALYQIGNTEPAIHNLRNLVRRYPRYADPRAALTAALWMQGKQGEAESQWVATIGLDNRYKNIDWVQNNRHWPPEMVSALNQFLQVQ